MEKPNYSEKPKKSQKNFNKSNKKIKDPCNVCDEELYLDDTYTQRVGMIDESDEVYGWMCPFCQSEFDVDGKIVRIFRDGKIQGEA